MATSANWGANFVVTVSFLALLGEEGDCRQVPETKNRRLAEIERDLGLPPARPARQHLSAPQRPDSTRINPRTAEAAHLNAIIVVPGKAGLVQVSDRPGERADLQPDDRGRQAA